MPDFADRTITAVLGPTNTGKTHYALERMLSRESGIIGLPLRLLAREIYDRIVALRGPNAVSLITGEEKIAPARARYHVATVEAMPLHEPVDFVAIDEIQLAADPDRGHVFTDRLLHARGAYETLFLGSDTARPIIANLVPKARFTGRERYSTLTWTGSRKISRLKPRTAVVAFSIDQVYAIAELLRRQRGGAAVVMGALSPRTRNAQVALYQQGEVDYMVATDAIGMGLNMDIDHVAFAGLAKFDGGRHRRLEAHELAQIAGRAGRYTDDGTFGVTGDAGQLDPETIGHIENHRFKPLTRVMWRNRGLTFATVEHLLASLDQPSDTLELLRTREAEDQTALRSLWEDHEVRDMTRTPAHVRLLWDVCSIPDFRKVSMAEHTTLLGRIYRFLRSAEQCIPNDWLAGQIERLDRVDGDIDALSKRLAFIRTWTYVANRSAWIMDAGHWQGETRGVEDRLSDALHQRLTQRFVDRRTSHLMRRLKQKERLVAEIDDKGQVSAEGHFLGRLDGFRFTVDESAVAEELKMLRSASTEALAAEFGRRADKLYLSPDTEIDVTDQGGLMWGTDAVGRVSKGEDPLAPSVTVFVDDIAGTAVAEKVERRLTHWLARRINALFEPMLAMRDDEEITGLAKGVAFRLAESFGIIRRREIASDLKQLAQEERALLRKHGVRFGQHFIFLPALLKPAPTRLRLLLWNLAGDHPDFAEAPPPGLVTVPVIDGMPDGYFEMAGYAALGPRALRIDMLERLADMIRPMDARGGFEATQVMLSITGCTLEQFAEMMAGLGFAYEKGERTKTVRQPAAEAVADEAAAESVPVDENSADGTDGAGSDDVVSGAAVPDDAEGTIAEVEVPQTEPTPTKAAPAEPGPPDEPSSEIAAPDADTSAAPSAEHSADAQPDAPTVQTAATPGAETEPAKPEQAAEAEIFYTFRLAPRGRPQRGPRRRSHNAGEGRGSGAADAGKESGGKEGAGRPRGRGRGDEQGFANARRKGKGKGPKGGKPQQKQDGGPRRTHAGPPRKERPIDPDNPFAILQQLKND